MAETERTRTWLSYFNLKTKSKRIQYVVFHFFLFSNVAFITLFRLFAIRRGNRMIVESIPPELLSQFDEELREVVPT